MRTFPSLVNQLGHKEGTVEVLWVRKYNHFPQKLLVFFYPRSIDNKLMYYFTVQHPNNKESTKHSQGSISPLTLSFQTTAFGHMF